MYEDMKILDGMKKDRYGEGIAGHDIPVVIRVRELQMPARMAAALVERWGLIACVFDGEDTAGRQKLRVMTSDELVTAACTTAEEFCKQVEARGWVLNIPEPMPNIAKQNALAEEA